MNEHIEISVFTMGHSSGFPDHYVKIKVGDRSLTPYMSKSLGRVQYEVDTWKWLMHGADKPNILSYDPNMPEGYDDWYKRVAENSLGSSSND